MKYYYDNLSLHSLREFVKGVGWVYEKWVDINGFEGAYAVSTFGRIKSYARRVWQPQHGGRWVNRKERIMRQKKCSDGYLAVTLSVNGKRRYSVVHRLVALMFVPNKYNKPEVNHISGDKKLNRPDKLEWVTDKENSIHAIEIGLATHVRGENNVKSKLNEMQVREIREKAVVRDRNTLTKLAGEYGVNRTCIDKIIKKVNWKNVN